MPPLHRFVTTRLPRWFYLPKAPSATECLGARFNHSAAADHSHATSIKILPYRDFKYEMASQEVTVVSQQSVEVVVDQKVKGAANTTKDVSAKVRRNRKKAVTSTTTEVGTNEKANVKLPKPKKAKKTKKQKKAEREAAETARAVKASEPKQVAQVIQITETSECTIEEQTFSRDPVSVPSSASGGVPEPTAAYLRGALATPSRLANPRRILIVMDLNGTLLHRPNKKRPSHFVERPHARVFMDYLLSNFVVAVWSSARPQNVNNMVASLLTPEQRHQCRVIWARDRFGLSLDDYNSRVQCYKRLTRLWSNRTVMAAHPDVRSGGRWDQSNTVLVDDSSEKARSEPHNLLQIPEYGGRENEQLFVLPQVHDYINELSYQADISRYIRQNPFKLDSGYKL